MSVASSYKAMQSFKIRSAFWNIHSHCSVGNAFGKKELEDSSWWRKGQREDRAMERSELLEKLRALASALNPLQLPIEDQFINRHPGSLCT